MSIDRYLVAEVHRDGRWQPVPELVDPDGRWAEVFWVTRRDVLLLEMLTTTTLGMHAGVPPDPGDSPLVAAYGQWADEMGLHWVDPEDWLVDTWADSALLLTGEVPARVAHLFTDGAQPFPLQALRAAWPDFEVQDDPRSCAQLADEPRDQHWGRAAFERHDAAPDGRVTVTWRASLAERVGDWRVEALAQLQAHTRGERVRLFLYWA